MAPQFRGTSRARWLVRQNFNKKHQSNATRIEITVRDRETERVFDGIPECIVFTYFLKNRQVAYVS